MVGKQLSRRPSQGDMDVRGWFDPSTSVASPVDDLRSATAAGAVGLCETAGDSRSPPAASGAGARAADAAVGTKTERVWLGLPLLGQSSPKPSRRVDRLADGTAAGVLEASVISAVPSFPSSAGRGGRNGRVPSAPIDRAARGAWPVAAEGHGNANGALRVQVGGGSGGGCAKGGTAESDSWNAALGRPRDGIPDRPALPPAASGEKPVEARGVPWVEDFHAERCLSSEQRPSSAPRWSSGRPSELSSEGDSPAGAPSISVSRRRFSPVVESALAAGSPAQAVSAETSASDPIESNGGNSIGNRQRVRSPKGRSAEGHSYVAAADADTPISGSRAPPYSARGGAVDRRSRPRLHGKMWSKPGVPPGVSPGKGASGGQTEGLEECLGEPDRKDYCLALKVMYVETLYDSGHRLAATTDII